MSGPRITDFHVAEALRLRTEDRKRWTYDALGERFGCTGVGIYLAMRNRRQGCDLRLAAADKRRAGLVGQAPRREDPAALKLLFDSIPADTRDLTQRFCGDPLPGRSALDRSRERGRP